MFNLFCEGDEKWGTMTCTEGREPSGFAMVSLSRVLGDVRRSAFFSDSCQDRSEAAELQVSYHSSEGTHTNEIWTFGGVLTALRLCLKTLIPANLLAQ